MNPILMVRPITRLRGLGTALSSPPREGCESLALLPLGSVTLPSLRRPPYGRVSERVILQNEPESESESDCYYTLDTGSRDASSPASAILKLAVTW